MDKEKANEAYNYVTKGIIKHYYYYKDQTEKSFLYMLHALKKEKDFYESDNGKWLGEDTQQEILKIINSHIDLLKNQLDIISNGYFSKSYDFDLTVEDIEKENIKYHGFGGGFCL